MQTRFLGNLVTNVKTQTSKQNKTLLDSTTVLKSYPLACLHSWLGKADYWSLNCPTSLCSSHAAIPLSPQKKKKSLLILNSKNLWTKYPVWLQLLHLPKTGRFTMKKKKKPGMLIPLYILKQFPLQRMLSLPHWGKEQHSISHGCWESFSKICHV